MTYRILRDQLDAPPAQQPKLPGLQAIVADRGYTGLAASHGLNLDIKRPPASPVLPPAKPGGKWRKGKRTFTPLRPLYKVENAFARLGMWRRLSRCYGRPRSARRPNCGCVRIRRIGREVAPAAPELRQRIRRNATSPDARPTPTAVTAKSANGHGFPSPQRSSKHAATVVIAP